MSELYASTLKYFHLAIAEFLPQLKKLLDNTSESTVKEEIEDLIEAYEDIDAKIASHHLNYDDPNRFYDGEPDEVEIAIPTAMVENLARLSHRMLFAWRERLEKLKNKAYLTDARKEEARHLENLIWPIEALLKSESHVLGRYAHLGPLVFPGESTKNDDGLVHKLTTLLEQIEQCYILGDSELLESKKLMDTEVSVKTVLGEAIAERKDEMLQLKYKKLTSGWSTQLKSGFHNRKTAVARLGTWKGLVEEVIGGNTGGVPIKEVYFSAGQSYDAIKALRSILDSAHSTIWLEDNYLHPSTLSILEPYIHNGGVIVRFLTKDTDNKTYKSFCVDFKKLKAQYPNAAIEARENSRCHDRYVIVDEKDVYHSGQSLHDLGGKASQINKVEDDTNRARIISDFKDWWDTGNNI